MSEDLMKLYSERILALAADIPHLGQLDAAQGRARRRSPLCGSTVTAEVVLRDGRVAEFAQDVKACALGQASAAIAGAAIPGRDRAEIEAARDALAAMLKAGGPVPAAPFDGYEALLPARDYRNRHASILLALEAAADAIAAAETAVPAAGTGS
ncbi:iron-sulfur cluster assembly scaffold protein [Frigidibacter sp. MR17.24]|uniref:iron-sulfur cluster assembly scaffold protein n=1 Tax=Frigidibacter sp. MR17.24 TaxID=3127345 RepID=UPI003012C039